MSDDDSKRYCVVCGKDMQVVVDGIPTTSIGVQIKIEFGEVLHGHEKYYKQFGVYADMMKREGTINICWECYLKRLGVPQPEETPRATDNEKIAEWLGYEIYHPIMGGVRQSMMRKSDGLGIFVPDYERHIALWHGEQGLLAKIAERGWIREFHSAWKQVCNISAPSPPSIGLAWRFCSSEPPELVKALVEMIETTAKEAKNG